MRVVLVAETSLLHMNGVTNSLLHVLRHLEGAGHQARVIAPTAGMLAADQRSVHGADVALLRSVGLPSYPEVRLTFARARRLARVVSDFQPDLVHLASPFVLGWQALRAAELAKVPTVAIYQTDIPGYARRYGIPAAEPALTHHLARIHKRATLTLAPSSSAIGELRALGVDRVKLWARGVDGEMFHPSKRSEAWRRSVAPNGEVVIGYVGRLAPEKQVADLRAIADLPGTRLVIVGDGPSRAALERALPNAVFLGFQGGEKLAEAVAGFDLFVHPGENETFCQTVQEALASGVPVVATGRGGPIDLVQNSRTGWLYRPGDLADLRARVLDLTGDAGKRRAFAIEARESVAYRTWASLGDELLGHYSDAIASRAPVMTTSPREPAIAVPDAVESRPRWSRYVALGDSITEGLCDDSRQATGEFRGWADRLALLLAHAGERAEPLLYANLAVRSRTIPDVLERQIPRALELGADLATILIGGNDMSRRASSAGELADRLAPGIARLRDSGCDVLLVTPFIPPNPFLRLLHDRTAALSREFRRVGEETGARVLDVADDPDGLDPRRWAADRVHLSSHGHRALSYRAAAALGVPGARQLGALDALMHDESAEASPEHLSTPAWMWTHVRPWLGRRLRGRTAGDGLLPRHDALVPVIPADPFQTSRLT
ncbi:MAG: GDSL-type esterase/lipase family protein [Pseudolysinimonas sp.]